VAKHLDSSTTRINLNVKQMNMRVEKVVKLDKLCQSYDTSSMTPEDFKNRLSEISKGVQDLLKQEEEFSLAQMNRNKEEMAKLVASLGKVNENFKSGTNNDTEEAGS
jgi:hypothetical protein